MLVHLVIYRNSLLQAELETQGQEEAGKLASETEKEVSSTSPLKKSEPVLQVIKCFLSCHFSVIR